MEEVEAKKFKDNNERLFLIQNGIIPNNDVYMYTHTYIYIYIYIYNIYNYIIYILYI